MEPDEEAIDTREDYSGASAPVIGGAAGGEDFSGAQAPVSPLPGQEPPPGAAPQGEEPSLMKNSYGPLAAPARGVKSIISYLMGADAMPPEALDGAGKTVDPQGQMTSSERNLLALQHARDNGGDEAAWALMQSNRVSYNAQTAFAKTALEGTAQKPADLRAAIDAANKAQANVLDGSNVEFAPLQGGRVITATVTTPGGQPDQIVLSPQQFARWLDVGGDGQWDKVMSAGAAQTLHRIAAEGPSRGATSLGEMRPLPGANRARDLPAAAPPIDNSESDAYDPNAEGNAPKTNFGKTPSTLNLSGSDARSAPVQDKTNYGEELEARAMRMFPSVSQEAERNQWMSAEEARYEAGQNKIDVAGETGRRKEEVARITGGAKVEAENARGAAQRDVAKTKNEGWQFANQNKARIEAAKLAQRATEMEHRDANSSQARAVKLLSSKMATLQPLNDQEKELAKQLGVQGLQAGSVTAPRSQAQTTPPAAGVAPGAPPVQGAKFFKGSWYTRGPNGESVPYRP